MMGSSCDTRGASSSGSWWSRLSQCWEDVFDSSSEVTQTKSCLLLYSSNVSLECFRLLAGSHESSSGP